MTLTANAAAQLEDFLLRRLQGDTEALLDPDIFGPENSAWCTALLELVRRYTALEQQRKMMESTMLDQRRRHESTQCLQAAMKQLGDVMATTLETHELCQAAAGAAVEELGYMHAAVLLSDVQRSRLELWAEWGADGPVPAATAGRRQTLSLQAGLAAHAWREDRAVVVNDLAADPVALESETPLTAGSLLCLPLPASAAPVGVLALSTTATDAFGEENVRQLRLFARTLGMALLAGELQARNQRIERLAMIEQAPCVVGDPWRDAQPPAGARVDGLILVGCADPARAARLQTVVAGLEARASLLPPDARDEALRAQVTAASPDALLLDLSDPDGVGWEQLTDFVAQGLSAYVPLLPCGFDDRSGQAWLGRPDAVLFKTASREDLWRALDLDNGESCGAALLAENNPAHVQRIGGWLDAACDQLFTALDGAQAVEALLSEPLRAIVCDVLLPDRCGLQLIAELVRRPHAPAPRCVLLLPEFLSEDERALLAMDARWTAALHGMEPARWVACLARELAAPTR